MTVHRSGALTVVAGDLQTTHRGVNIAIKVIDWGAGPPQISLLKQINGTWLVVENIEELDDRTDGTPGYAFERQAQEAGGMLNWVRGILLPKINAALLKLFPASGGTTPPAPPPATGNPLDDLDSLLIATLKWAPQADGTIKVSA